MKTKKIISLLLIMVMVLTFVPTIVKAEETYKVNYRLAFKKYANDPMYSTTYTVYDNNAYLIRGNNRAYDVTMWENVPYPNYTMNLSGGHTLTLEGDRKEGNNGYIGWTYTSTDPNIYIKTITYLLTAIR